MKKSILTAVITIAFIATLLLGFFFDPGSRKALADSDNKCLTPLTLEPNLPADQRLGLQQEFDCFAWQEFIALNWPASPTTPGEPDTSKDGSEFGDPKDFRPVVWETYKEVYEVFQPEAQPPSPWGQPQQLPSKCEGAEKDALTLTPSVGYRVFRMTSKISDQAQVVDEVIQAQAGDTAWLTAQNGKRTRYEIRLNQDEFEYIWQNQLYNALKQYEIVQPGQPGLRLPDGSPQSVQYGDVGAIEIKAAWQEIDNPTLWSRYKMTDAIIYDETAQPICRPAKMGLVGLHIAHKTQSRPQWVWVTFEHVDNDPDRKQVKTHQLHPSYMFYNPICDSSNPKCEPNQKPQDGQPFDQPVQVLRETPIPDSVQQLNDSVHQMIALANPDSVWQYYQLVNTLWPQSTVIIPPGAKIPLPQGGPTPTVLANTTMETYLQGTNCLDCHQRANIAPSSKEKKPQWASDYSFILSRAREQD